MPKLLLATISMVGTVLALEWGARVLRLDAGFFLQPGPENCLQRSRTLSMEFRPRCTGDLGGTHFATNALGFRGPQPRDHVTRILAIGDSCTWGWHVREDESYPAVLQELLDQHDGPGRYQVLNAGAPGYTSYQVLVALREKGLVLHPSIVVLSAGFNDPFTTGDVEAQIASERRLMPLLQLDDLLLRHSTLYRWTRWRASGGSKPSGAVRVTPEGYAHNLRAMIEAARAQGSHVLVLDFWHPLTHRRTYRDALAGTVEAMRVPLVTYDGPRLDVVHPTAAGYRMLATEIERVLRAEEWVP